MLQSECLELPRLALVRFHEIENTIGRPTLQAPPADWTDPELAALTTQEELTGFFVLSNPTVCSALLESFDAALSRLDAREIGEPELTLALTGLEPEQLLRLILVNRELTRRFGREMELLAWYRPARAFYT